MTTSGLKPNTTVSDARDAARKLKISEWTETVKCHLTTPNKMNSNKNESEATTCDSAKKRRHKFIKYVCSVLF